MPPKQKQGPMMALDTKTLAHLPVSVGEKVAFHEQHDEQPGMYGLIDAVGFDPDGPGIRLDVYVIDPADGVVDYEKPTVRISLEEIQ